MTKNLWKRFRIMKGFHCLTMKDDIQAKILEDTQNTTPDAIVAYFTETSRHFWQGKERRYPDMSTAPMAVREKKTRMWKN